MISTKEQEELFQLISEYIEEDITCIAIGGTAMMLQKYKTTTKDIDLIFRTEKERKIFVKAIKQLGYKEKSLGNIYDQKRKEHKGKPTMYSRGDERFDLFVKTVFGYEVSFEQEDIIQRNDFISKKELKIHILSKEELILLKAITGREKDYEDIETILKIEKEIDWENIVKKASLQKKNNSWILLDLEKALNQLKKKYSIKKDIFERIYKAQE